MIINEACANNGSLVHDEDNDEPDWIELYNAGSSEVSLAGYAISDSGNLKWFFPDIIMSPHGFLLVFASGKDRKGTNLHTSFSINKDGDVIKLFHPNGLSISALKVSTNHLNHSSGRKTDGDTLSDGIFAQPTPGTSNNNSKLYKGYTPNPLLSEAAGFYSSTVFLDVTTDNSSRVFYTLDGSPPTTSSTLYTVPLKLDSSFVVRVRAYAEDSAILPSEIITNTYFIHYSSKLPVISLTTDPYNLWDWNYGIYVLGPNASPNYPYLGANFWQDWERPVHVEFFETNHEQAFEQDAGVSINGGSVSRTRPMQSLRLVARNQYGPNDFHHRVFSQKNIDKFKILVLRNSSGDYNKTHFRDGALHKLMLGHVNIDLLSYRPAAVFINGKYWGVHNIREKFSKHYLKENYQVDPESLDILEEDSSVVQGDFTAFKAMFSFVTENDMHQQIFYDSACELIDISSFIDYFIAETYLSNIDWPYNNIKYWRVRAPGNKWRYLLMDLDISLGNMGWSPAEMDVLGRLFGPFGDKNKHVALLKSLLKNERFRQSFINRYADLVNTLFSTKNMKAHIEKVKDNLEDEMPLHFLRWGNSMQGWNDEIYNVVMPYIERRPAYALKYVQDTFHLKKEVEVTLNVWPPGAGLIKINSIEPSPLPWSGTYFDGVPVTVTVYPNPGYTFSKWNVGHLVLQEPANRSITINTDTNTTFTACFISDGNSTGLTVYPNPVNSTLNAGFVLDEDKAGCFTINTILGQEIYRSEKKCYSSGLVKFEADISFLKPGVYIVSFLPGNQALSAKFIIIQ